MAAEGRTCGTCALCCKVMRVPVLDKPTGVWCRHCTPGTATPCTIYPTRPPICVDFECLWLQGAVPLSFRPDRLKAVLTTAEDGQTLMVHEDVHQTTEASRREPLRELIARVVGRNGVVIVVRGAERRLYGKDHLVRARLKTLDGLWTLIDAQEEGEPHERNGSEPDPAP